MSETNNSTSSGAKLKLRLTLTPPPGYNFDMYVYLNTDSDTLECSQAYDFSLKPVGQVDALVLEWGEGSVPNGADDSRWVAINVKHGADSQSMCTQTAQWTLKAEGNVN